MKSAFLLVALLVLTGCSAPAPRRAVTGQAAGQLPDRRVMVDPALRGILEIKSVRDMPATQGYLKFQVDVHNLSSTARTIIYEVDWLDRDGVSLGISMEEPPCTLFGHETLPLAITSPAASARDFRLTFRPRSK
jgi:uncharacterized protein YcfL